MGKSVLASYVLFFISFNLNSLLVFYVVPFLIYVYENREKIRSNLFKLFYIIIFTILPFVYYVPKTIFFPAFGLYEGYNPKFNILYLITSPILQFLDLVKVNLDILDLSFIILLYFFFRWVFMKLKIEQPSVNTTTKRNALIGVCMLICALFPYWILGHVPSFADWTSRHQILMPFGLAVVALAGLRAVNIRLLHLALAILMYSNISMYINVWIDQRKLQGVQAAIASVEYDLLKNSLVVLDHSSIGDLALRRQLRFYEVTSILSNSIRSESFFAISHTDLDRLVHHGFGIKNLSPFHLVNEFDSDNLGNVYEIIITHRPHSDPKLDYIGFPSYTYEAILTQLPNIKLDKCKIEKICISQSL